MAIDLSSYKLTFDDEFNSFSSTPQGLGGWQSTLNGARTLSNNGEQQYYSDSTVGVNPFSLHNGELTITAAPGGNPDGLWYNSGIISTYGMFNQQYGYFEMRAELPQGQGMWPGFWLLQADGSWPPEIDILEAFGAPSADGQGGDNMIHINAISTAPGQSKGDWVAIPGNIYDSYHTYGVDWQPDFITYYIDGAAVGQVKTPDDMHKPMYVIANLAVGGNWIGSAGGEASQMNIDYIRAYSKDWNAQSVAAQPISSPDGADTSQFADRGTPAGSDQIVLRVSEDGWNGDARFTVTVDGKQVGDVHTVTASHAAGQWQDIALSGSFGSGPHTVTVNFINDAWGTGGDRNMYVQSLSLNGETIAGNAARNYADSGWGPAYDPSAAVMLSTGSAMFDMKGSGTPSETSPPVTQPDSGAGTNALTVRVSEDAWNGDAQFRVLVDGNQIGGTQTATAHHGQNQWQDITLNGNFDTGAHTVRVEFLNDGWGGSASTDRNLYVQSIDINGQHIAGNTAINTAANGDASADPGAAVMMINGTADFHAGSGSSTTPTTPPPSSTGSLTVRVSEDAWNGDAQFKIFVDDHQIGGIQTATATHSLGQWQDITLDGSFDTSAHTVRVEFVNDAWGGSAGTDRNLYVQSVDINGQHIAGSAALNTAANGGASADPGAAVMMVNGTADFKADAGTSTSPPPPAGTTASTIVLHVAEDAWNGDAQFKVLVDGQQVGGVQTATAHHGLGQVQDITLTGDFGSLGPDKVGVQFINDSWGGNASADRNLYVQSIDINGVHFAGNTAANDAANGSAWVDPGAAVMMTNGTAMFDVHHSAPPDIWHV